MRSLAALFGVAPDRLARALPDTAAVVGADAEAELARAIVAALTAILGGPPVTPSRIHFFHGSRAFEPRLFAQRGLLPLPAVLDDLWERMRGLAPEIPSEDFAALREGLEDGRIEALTYKHRSDTHDDGPNGVLVRDVLLDSKAYHSSAFVRIPEIVEDICVAAATSSMSSWSRASSGRRRRASSSSPRHRATSIRPSRRPPGTPRPLFGGRPPAGTTRSATSTATASRCRRGTSSSWTWPSGR